jgi:hypothetical protein
MGKSHHKQVATARHHLPASAAREKRRDFDATQINFDPDSETLDDDYAAFHDCKKTLPHAEAEAIEARFQATFVKQREAQRRFVNNVFQFWTVCQDPACKRNEGCAGDPYACHQRWWPWTPECQKVRYRAYVKARAEDRTHEQACAHAEAEVKRLADHIARVDAEQHARLDALEAAERAQRADAAMPAREPPLPRERQREPRVRVL